MRCALAVVLLIATGCGSTDHSRAQRDVLARTTDPVEASAAVRALAAPDCTALSRAFALLDERAAAFDAATFIGLVEDGLAAAAPTCPAPLGALEARPGAAAAIARARLLADRPADALAALDGAPDLAAIARLRARLLRAQGRDADARDALARAIELEDDLEARAELARAWLRAGDPRRALELAGDRAGAGFATVRAAALAALDRRLETLAEIAGAPVHLRAEIARAAVAAAPDPAGLAAEASAPVEVLVAAAEHAAPRDAAALLERAAARSPEDADLHIALATTRERAGDRPGAIAAWDRAAALAPAAEPPRLAPIRLLAAAGDTAAARDRAAALARGAEGADALRLASAAAAAAGDRAAAIGHARAALAARPDDGQLAFLLAARLEEAGELTAATDALAKLLVCGAHGRPWHRHEVAGGLARLRAAGASIDAALAAVPCTPVEPDDLAGYTAELARSNVSR